MLDGEQHHTVLLDTNGVADYRSVIGFFARQLLKELRLVGGYDVLYGKVKAFMRENLFESSPVNLEDPQVLRNLSEPAVGKILFDSFKTSINALTVQDKGSTRVEDRIRLRDTRPFRTEHRPYIPAKKSLFNKIVGEPNADGLELAFAKFLDDAPDVTAFSKNYLAVGFKVEYVKANGDLSSMPIHMADLGSDNFEQEFTISLMQTEEGTLSAIEAALERGCFLELNAHPDRLDLTDVYCREAKDAGVMIAMGSDAHGTGDLRWLRLGVQQARRGWLEKSDVLNTRPLVELRRLLKRKK